jgi:hypothetical protein
MQEATFDIWSGWPPQTGQWLETVAGLGNARKRMLEIAAAAPGPYFIFSAWNGYILEQIDTREEQIAHSIDNSSSLADQEGYVEHMGKGKRDVQ